jgi:ribosomal protein S18 acetylase RimI-like enzyme
MNPALTLRPVAAHEDALLFEIFASARNDADDPTACEDRSDDRRLRLEHEFASRQRGYRTDFPGVEYLIITAADEPIGRIYLQRTNRHIFVVDIVLLEQWRGLGIGSSLLRSLIAEAGAGERTVRLHVEKSNARAFRLYARLGFTIIGDARTHHLMECQP